MKSKLLSLRSADFWKGLIMAIGTPLLYFIQEAIPGWNIPPVAKIAISAAVTYLLKNLFTDDTQVAKNIAKEQGQKIVPKTSIVTDRETGKQILSIIGLIIFCGTASAQKGFFGTIQLKQPTAQVKVTNGRSITFQNVKTTQDDSTFNAIRPEVSVGTIFAGGTAKVVAGTGIAFQRITYKYPKGTVGQPDYVPGRSYVNFSVGLHVLAGVSVDDNRPAKIPSAALLFSALNGQVSAGPAYGDMRDLTTGKYEGKWGLMLNWKIMFNN